MISENGWEVVGDAGGLRWWNAGDARLQMRPGPAGFLLCHVATWFDLYLEPLGHDGDDFGWSLRKIGGTDVWSNHASATAIDLNAAQHPQGGESGFSASQASRIRRKLAGAYQGLVRWGGDFHSVPDEMHWEIAHGVSFDQVKILVAELRQTHIGHVVEKSNSGS